MKVRIAIAGVGNCASALVQGLKFYSGPSAEGLWHPDVAGLKPSGIELVAAFEIDARKVGLDVSKALFAPPNVARRYVNLRESGVRVSAGLMKGSVPPHLKEQKLAVAERRDAVRVLEKSGADVLVNLISSGSDQSSEAYARAALEAGCSFVNCTPAQLMRNPILTSAFSKRKRLIVGDDLMSQFGGTVFHKGLLGLMVKRGIKITKSYQLDVGGGSETFNTMDEGIKLAKRSVKTSSVASEVPYKFETVAGTTDFVDYLGNDRTSYFWAEGNGFMGSGVEVDVYLRSADGANAGNVLLDVIRATYESSVSGTAGAANKICAYGFKSHPKKTLFEAAYKEFEAAFVR